VEIALKGTARYKADDKKHSHCTQAVDYAGILPLNSPTA
jgi:hypothetical protein